MWLTASWSFVELEELVVHLLIELHDSSLVSATVAVVGSTEDGNDILIVAPVVSLEGEQQS
jgi:predicted transcriptional regulator